MSSFKISPVALSATTAAIVYNFEVADTHTYFVGTVDGGVWVHNDCYSIAKAFRRQFGGDVYELTPKDGQYVDRAVDPASGPLYEDGSFKPWNSHAVQVQDGMVRDPMMTGNNKPIPMEQWQHYWNNFSDHNFGPSR